MKLLIICLLACLVAASTASDGRDMYFAESSGDEKTDSLLPFDDEDTGGEASGETDETTEVITVDVGEDDEDGEQEETIILGSSRNAIPENEPEKGVVPEDNEGTNAEELESDLATGASTQFLAAVIVGGCIGLLFAICVIMLLVYRMRKKDEGSYALEYGLDKKPQGNYEYTKGVDSKEYFA